MAVLIPAIGSCTFDSGGERRFAERLESHLDDDYLCWYNVALGTRSRHPDFIVFHPRRGLLILEIKDWRTRTLLSADRQHFTIATASGPKSVENPLEQARQCAHAAIEAMQRDPQLVFSSGRAAGQLLFPWSYGVVLPNLTRRQFDDGQLAEVIALQRVICQDEMTEAVDAEDFQRRLWEMFPLRFHGALSLPQIDRVRWHLFPEVRIPAFQTSLPLESEQDGTPPAPDLVRVMDLQQEQLARSLGEGHRVIHGVAGSGKTLILGYRAEHLARIVTKPILVLCYNESLARKLAAQMRARGISDKVHTHHFHQWCRAQLKAFHVSPPPSMPDTAAFFAALVERVIHAVEQGQIPAGQYDAILIDEAHDFRPEWLKLVVQMVDPRTRSLLVLYDDAQSIYGDDIDDNRDKGGKGSPRRKFSFRSVGIQAAGRTTILKVNYRNTDAILRFARDTACHLLDAGNASEDADEDAAPLLQPLPAGRPGAEPQLIRLPSLQSEAEFIAHRLKEAHRTGTAWRDMAVIYREYERDAKLIRRILPAHGIPLVYFRDTSHQPTEDKVTLITMHSCKGLEYPLVVIPAADLVLAAAETSSHEARLLYVAMTRATQELVLCGQDSKPTP
jgi:hypothetical protein